MTNKKYNKNKGCLLNKFLIKSSTFQKEKEKRLDKLRFANDNNIDGKSVIFKSIPISVFPGVFDPVLGEGTFLLSDCLSGLKYEKILEIGTGTGILSILSAKFAKEIVATDYSFNAIKCANYNIAVNNVQDIIDIRQGNLFDCIRSGESFDLIIFNVPFMDGNPKNIFEISMYDTEYRTLTEFINNGSRYLTENGVILLAFSNVGSVEFLINLIEKNCLNCKLEKYTSDVLSFFVIELSNASNAFTNAFRVR